MYGKKYPLRKCTAFSIFLLLLTAPAITTAKTIYVDDDNPADFNNVQAATNDSNDGDTIVVKDGTYTGDGNRDIDFKGKAITVRSENGPTNCIIDCEASGCGFYFHSGEDENSILDGFTITNVYGFYGGAIKCDGGSPTIMNNTITRNHAHWGAGIWCDGSPVITNNTIVANSADFGGGIYCRAGSPVIANNTITRNIAHWCGGILCSGSPVITNNTITWNTGIADAGTGYPGGGIACDGSPTITNNTVIGNSAGEGGGISLQFADLSSVIANNTIAVNKATRGGGICCLSSSPTITNCILWGNTADIGPEIAAMRWPTHSPSILTVGYSNITGCEVGIFLEEGSSLIWGNGNIDADPRFADAAYGDYHLKSQAGRWNANEGRWTKDDRTSSCIDAGDPHSPIGLEPFPNGGIINMGAYGGTAEASKSYFGEPVCETIVAGDINGDCKVNLKDFALMAFHWLEDHQ